jgi:hypothetical protein
MRLLASSKSSSRSLIDTTHTSSSTKVRSFLFGSVTSSHWPIIADLQSSSPPSSILLYRTFSHVIFLVQTGFGATGSFWAHEHWGLTEGQDDFPDFVSFSKKAQASGFYHRRETRPTTGYRNYNSGYRFCLMRSSSVHC